MVCSFAVFIVKLSELLSMFFILAFEYVYAMLDQA